MTPVTVFQDKTVALFGLGGSGLATALALRAAARSLEPAFGVRRRGHLGMTVRFGSAGFGRRIQ
ncbi:hypothetical protein CTI14_60975, partial [Methylobacterium radiotolerans]